MDTCDPMGGLVGGQVVMFKDRISDTYHGEGGRNLHKQALYSLKNYVTPNWNELANLYQASHNQKSSCDRQAVSAQIACN